jgi:hypothetical protein
MGPKMSLLGWTLLERIAQAERRLADSARFLGDTGPNLCVRCRPADEALGALAVSQKAGWA